MSRPSVSFPQLRAKKPGKLAGVAWTPDIDAASRNRRQAKLAEVLVHQLELLASNRQPRILLHIAGRHLQERRRFAQFPLRLHPPPITLAVRGKGGAVQDREDAKHGQLACYS